jgi:hypothetical protein
MGSVMRVAAQRSESKEFSLFSAHLVGEKKVAYFFTEVLVMYVHILILFFSLPYKYLTLVFSPIFFLSYAMIDFSYHPFPINYAMMVCLGQASRGRVWV